MKKVLLRVMGWGSGNTPPLVVLLTSVTVLLIYIPESLLSLVGFDIFNPGADLSRWLEYQLLNINNKQSVCVFWVVCPYVFLINLVLLFFRANVFDFVGYSMRRKAMLKTNGTLNRHDFSLLFGSFLVSATYIVVLLFVRSEPSFLGDFVPNSNRVALTLLHGTGLFTIPASISVFCRVTVYIQFPEKIRRLECLKDKSLMDLGNLTEPDDLAEEIIENLEAGLNSSREVLRNLSKT